MIKPQIGGESHEIRRVDIKLIINLNLKSLSFLTCGREIIKLENKKSDRWKMKVVLLVLLLTGVSFQFCQSQIIEDAAEAFEQARASQRPVLLVFSGSDWCAPCIRFHNNILSKESFLSYAADHFIVLKADFPQRKKLPQTIVDQNEKLAEQFNAKGQFPHLVLISSDQKLIKTLSFKNQNVDQFISELSLQFAE